MWSLLASEIYFVMKFWNAIRLPAGSGAVGFMLHGKIILKSWKLNKIADY